jgi:hypothetical protein
MKETKDDKQTIDLLVKVPTLPQPWPKSFPKTAKVKEVIDTVVSEFHFAPNGNYDLRLESNPTEPLDPKRPLVSYHLTDGTVLIFSDLGIGVNG